MGFSWVIYVLTMLVCAMDVKKNNERKTCECAIIIKKKCF